MLLAVLAYTCKHKGKSVVSKDVELSGAYRVLEGLVSGGRSRGWRVLKILFGHDNISKIPGDTPKYTPTTPAFGNPGSAPGGHIGLLSPCVERLGLDWKVRLS